LYAAATGLGHETMLQVAGEAGLRKGEIIGLRWGDINLDARRIAVRRSIRQERGQGAGVAPAKFEKPTKTGRALSVAISSTTRDRLAA
jgi:integrase